MTLKQCKSKKNGVRCSNILGHDGLHAFFWGNYTKQAKQSGEKA